MNRNLRHFLYYFGDELNRHPEQPCTDHLPSNRRRRRRLGRFLKLEEFEEDVLAPGFEGGGLGQRTGAGRRATEHLGASLAVDPKHEGAH